MLKDISSRKKEIQSRRAQLERELQEITDIENSVADKKRFHQIALILDNSELFLQLVEHQRTSCSDDDPSNGYTTAGQGGHLRCTKCGLINASRMWKDNKSWLINTESAKDVEAYLGFYFGFIELDITTDPE